MITYFDTSALVKLLIEEPGSGTAEQAWQAADARVCCTIGLAEAAAAVRRAWRIGRIDETTTHALLDGLDELWTGVARVLPDDELVVSAAQHAVLFGLRGYDAVHLAATIEVRATLVAADGALLTAARRAGLATIDVAG